MEGILVFLPDGRNSSWRRVSQMPHAPAVWLPAFAAGLRLGPKTARKQGWSAGRVRPA